MFNKKTVFVVGAGGSREVGLPMGEQLKSEIAQRVDIKFPDGYTQASGDRKITDALRLFSEKRGERDINQYLHAGWAIAAAMPQAISIDNFLHTHSEDQYIVQIGKLGIVSSILSAERSSSIYSRRDDRIKFENVKTSWHNTFTRMLLEGVQRSRLDKVFENVSFITFNYDRCIEHYLSHAIANYFLLDIKQAQEIVSQLTVIHPYGRVGRLPWQHGDTTGVEFGLDIHSSQMADVASQVRVFTERVEDETVVKAMHGLIAEARLVVYLGFSYGSMNLDLLSLTEAPEPRNVLGTAYNISKPNVESIIVDLKNSMGPNPAVVQSVELTHM